MVRGGNPVWLGHYEHCLMRKLRIGVILGLYWGYIRAIFGGYTNGVEACLIVVAVQHLKSRRHRASQDIWHHAVLGLAPRSWK